MIDLKELLLQQPELTLAVAESVSCGRIQARLGLISGASLFFRGGVCTYDLDTKVKLLGVAREQAEAVNCVSGEIAEQMAIGVCSLFGAKVGLATTGYAEKSPERAVSEPFAWWAIAHDLGDGRMAVHSSMVECPGSNRASAQEAISIAALSALVRYLRSVRQKG